MYKRQTLGYETTVVTSDADEVCLLLDQFEADPRTGRLQRSVTINQTTATASVTACEAEGRSPRGMSRCARSAMINRLSTFETSVSTNILGFPALCRMLYMPDGKVGVSRDSGI